MANLTVPGALESLDAIADFVLSEAGRAGLDHKASYRLRLAIDEIATNSILYGYAARGLTGDLALSSTPTDGALTIVLEDSGPPYDPRQRDLEDVEAQFDKPLDERGMGGLGVYFAVHGVDEFRYERVGDRNRNSFTVCRAVVANGA